MHIAKEIHGFVVYAFNPSTMKQWQAAFCKASLVCIGTSKSSRAT